MQRDEYKVYRQEVCLEALRSFLEPLVGDHVLNL
jgi:hypothetical protein